MNKYADKNYFRKPEDYRLVSEKESKYVHVEAYEKVTGRAKYGGDYYSPDMLYGKAKYSAYAHAKVLSIDTSKAEALPGVKCILTGKDFGPIRYGGHGKGAHMDANVADDSDEQVICLDEACYYGEVVAAVCATTEAIAQKAVDLIEIEYEPLPGCFDPIEAVKEGAPAVRTELATNMGNCSFTKGTVKGKNFDEEFENAYYVEVGDYTTHKTVHACIEPHGCYATYDPIKDQYTIYPVTSSSWANLYWLSHVLGVDESHIHVIRPYCGGSFGGKNNCAPHHFCACVMAKRTGRPVRFVLTREEEFVSQHGRHPFVMHIETAFNEEGIIQAKKARYYLDGGAYGKGMVAPVKLSALWSAFPYKIDCIDFESKRVYTNKAINGAMRGYTACQVQFANEVAMNRTAEALGIDPLEIRRRNALEPGYRSPAGLVVTSCALKECIDDTQKYMNWPECKKDLKPGEGIGFSTTAFVGGTASPIFETPQQVQTNATVRVNFEGIVSLYSNLHDNGQGADTVAVMIVAEELGLDMNEVKLIQPSTYNAGFDSGAYGSRITFLGGNAVRRAAVEVKKKLLEVIAAKWDADPHTLDLVDHNVICRDMGREHLSMPWREAVFSYMASIGGDELIGVGSYYHRTNSAQYHGKPSNYAPTYVFSSTAVHLTVDMETGVLDIDDFFFAHDCGQALNPKAVEGQLQGSVYSGIGYSVFEEVKERDGKIINPNFRDYRIPTALDIPHITTKYDYPPDPEGPMGAKECGEGTAAPVGGAIANAITMATGIKIDSLPLDPERIWRMMREQGKIKIYE